MSELKGALVSFMPTFAIPIPNVTIFQFNPETITHSWSQVDNAPTSQQTNNPQAVPGMPGEEFSMTISLDSNEDIADEVPISAQLAEVSGVYTRLASLEMMLYPAQEGAIGKLLGQASAALGLGGSSAVTWSVPESAVPIVLFVWGLFRIVPVRLTGLSTVEKLYDSLLNPIHAEVQLKIRVLTPAELNALGEGVLAKLANVAYDYTLGVREAGALANLGNAGASLAKLL
jgi:hypothetical protein